MKTANIILCLLVSTGIALDDVNPPWGFFGHRKINRMAVFTLPLDMLSFYKPNIEYITEHAVDPDKRRYSSPFEAVRHYIDLDHWGEMPFEKLPRSHSAAILQYAEIISVTGHDTTHWILPKIEPDMIETRSEKSTFCKRDAESLSKWLKWNLFPDYYEGFWEISGDQLDSIFQCTKFEKSPEQLIVFDRFSEYGIVPYHLESAYYSLANAFKENDAKSILRKSAEIGHYISDACVPLHTTQNYNGQMTGQLGIHSFWESRIPELFADENYDYLVGPPKIIDHPRDFFWNIVLESHELVDSVLLIEKRIRRNYPIDQQYCFEDRKDRLVRLECKEFAEHYQKEMAGMVEKRMRDAIHYVSSTWYSAWVLGGQPDLNYLLDNSNWTQNELEKLKKEELEYKNGKPLGRPHSNENN